MSKAASNPTGPKFPGYWRGKDPASKAKSKMVGGAQESVIKELNQTLKDNQVKLTLEEKYNLFKEQQPLTWQTAAGPLRSTSGQPVISGATTDIKPQDKKKDQERFKKQNQIPAQSQPSQAQAIPITQRGQDRAVQLDVTSTVEPESGRKPISIPKPPVAPSLPKSVLNLALYNNIADPNKIRVGQELYLPGMKTKYIVAKGDNLYNIARGIYKGQPPTPESETPAIEEAINSFKKFLEYANMQDPNVQTTSPARGDPSNPFPTPAEQKKAAQAQRVDVSTVKNMLSGLKSNLPQNLDTNALASAVTKINDQQALTAPEQMAMTALTPLIAQASEMPQTAPTLKTALSTAAMLRKKGM